MAGGLWRGGGRGPAAAPHHPHHDEGAQGEQEQPGQEHGKAGEHEREGVQQTLPRGIETAHDAAALDGGRRSWCPHGRRDLRHGGALIELGTVSYRSAQAQDVTATYIDTQARIDPARDSITRVRALMAKATDLQQLLVLESELTRRQADLDALTQQLADLEQRTTMSEVTATMWTPAAATVVEGSGVVGGLNAAWEGLLDSLTLVLTGLAVLLPWLLLLALGAFIVVRVMRRRRGAAAPTSP